MVPRGDRRGRRPVVDTWWQTETGGIMISPLPGARRSLGSATFPLPGISAELVDEAGNVVTLAATPPRPARGQACCAAFGAIPSATRTPTGVASPVATSPATAPSSTTTATCGCSGALDDVMNVPAPHLHHGGRVGARRTRRRRGGGRRRSRPDDRPGDHRLRHPARRRRGGHRRPAHARCRGDRGDANRRRSTSPRPAEDLQRQDHAPAAAHIATGRNLGDTTTLADATVVDEIKRRASEAPPKSDCRDDATRRAIDSTPLAKSALGGYVGSVDQGGCGEPFTSQGGGL